MSMKYDSLLRPRTAKISQEASFLRRAGAFLFDILLIDIVITAPFTPLFTSMVARVRTTDVFELTYTNTELTAIMLVFLIAYLYFVVFEYVLGQTVGMSLLNIHSDGDDRLFTMLVRNSFLLPFFPFVMFWIIEPLAIMFKRRGVLEYLTKTRTVHKREVLI